MSVGEQLVLWFEGKNDLGIQFNCGEQDLALFFRYFQQVPETSVYITLNRLLTSKFIQELKTPLGCYCVPEIHFLEIKSPYMKNYKKLEKQYHFRKFINDSNINKEMNENGQGDTIYISIIDVDPVKIVNLLSPMG